MKLSIVFLLFPFILAAQHQPDTTGEFKKRVLESTEIDLLTSFYTQNGNNAAVTGGIGTEQLNDFATNINISIPLNDDDILTIDATVSAYTSASSSNLNPFSGASTGGEDDDDDKNEDEGSIVTGSPWVESSGASKSDVWVNGNFIYSHHSNDRNNIFSAGIGFANEFDYTSFSGNTGFAKSFNEDNTELNVGISVFLDHWKPAYPTEIKTYIDGNGNLNYGFFNGVNILDNNGSPIDKNGQYVWKPASNYLVDNKRRNTFSFSLAFSQILTLKLQFSAFTDIVYQTGWLANPMQRVYFADIDNFFIGNPASINIYTDPANKDVFQLADDIERLPGTRIKFPIGFRMNYYFNEYFMFRTYYRYYFDDWGITSNTIQLEMPIKISLKFTLIPNYRFYQQTASNYFAPFEQHLSSEKYYTSDYDLSAITSNQFGIGIKYTDIFTKGHIWKLGLKSLTLEYNNYSRNTGLSAHIVSFGSNFVIY